MYGVVTISTKPASHDAYLTTLVVGQKEETQTLQLDTPQQRLIIPQKLIAGETNNQIDPRAQYAVVAGGNENKIGVDADSAAIGAGYSNEVNARRASIGAGYDNTVGSGGDNAFIGGGDQNKVFISNGVIVG
jgi:hypothetical protein